MRSMKFCAIEICFYFPLFFFGSSNNVLHRKEDLQKRVLLYACINCNYQEEAEDHCVYRIKINHILGQDSKGEQEDVVAKTTLPITKNVTCSLCNHSEAVFFQDVAKGEDSLSLFFICCNPSCGHKWRD
ncbi:hypothetical protein J5N97_018491 [Dioscorea zingiberensis]|uniref:TFIIS-type domain-containing protein n=1 Tax=Dioscorea zingiberensis TaxID=325984 RepID=A0A9D5HBR6_9LILI|nr:hypothetical protein J5N97_018491 [Dioscorea zingiberensis]